MERIGEYILCVAAAGILCSLLTALLGDKGTAAAAGKLVTGLVLAFVVISPVAKIKLQDLEGYFDQIAVDGNAYIAEGEALAKEEMSSIIKSQTEAYIRDKAAQLDVSLQVEAVITGDDTLNVEAVRISGSVSPYRRQQLQEIIASDLGIPKEKQIWTN